MSATGIAVNYASDVKKQIVNYINQRVDIPNLDEEAEEYLFTTLVEQFDNLISENRMSYFLLVFFNLFVWGTLKVFNIV